MGAVLGVVSFFPRTFCIRCRVVSFPSCSDLFDRSWMSLFILSLLSIQQKLDLNSCHFIFLRSSQHANSKTFSDICTHWLLWFHCTHRGLLRLAVSSSLNSRRMGWSKCPLTNVSLLKTEMLTTGEFITGCRGSLRDRSSRITARLLGRKPSMEFSNVGVSREEPSWYGKLCLDSWRMNGWNFNIVKNEWLPVAPVIEKQFRFSQNFPTVNPTSLLRIFSVGGYYGIIIIVVIDVGKRTESHLTPLLSVWYLGGRAAPRLR